MKTFSLRKVSCTAAAACMAGLLSFGFGRGILDHHLTTAVQLLCKISEKPVVTTTNCFFLVCGVAVKNQQNLRFNVGLHCFVVVLRQLRQGRF